MGGDMEPGIRAFLRRRRAERQVRSEQEAFLADLGLNRQALDSLAHAPADVPDRMAAMAAEMGLTREALRQDEVTYGQALLRCAGCEMGESCSKSLALRQAMPEQAREACPNRAEWRR